jgi:hypothetical protein
VWVADLGTYDGPDVYTPKNSNHGRHHQEQPTSVCRPLVPPNSSALWRGAGPVARGQIGQKRAQAFLELAMPREAAFRIGLDQLMAGKLAHR